MGRFPLPKKAYKKSGQKKGCLALKVFELMNALGKMPANASVFLRVSPISTEANDFEDGPLYKVEPFDCDGEMKEVTLFAWSR